MSEEETRQKAQLARVARLARLPVAEGDSADFAAIAEWFEKVKQIDTEGIDPMTNPRERQGKEKGVCARTRLTMAMCAMRCWRTRLTRSTGFLSCLRLSSRVVE